MSGDQERLDPHFSHRPGTDSTGEERFKVVIGAVGPLNGTNRVQFRVGQTHQERPTGDSPEDHSGRGVLPRRSTGHYLVSPHGAGR
jgi:hypothetical protein